MAAYTAVDDSEAYFQAVLYTGDGADGNDITLVGDTDLQPDFLWIKERSTTNHHRIYDSVRGVNAALISSDELAEDQYAAYGQLESFDSDGFTVGQGTGDPGNGAGTNASSATIVAWCWKESATSGFDIVAYTGSGSARTISHSLSAVPGLIIVKNRDTTDEWQVYHAANTAAPETDYLELSDLVATADAADRWNDTAPTSSVFSLGDGDEVNTNTEDYIAYCFAEKQGFSKFGSYVGNGNADGSFIYTGFRPAWFTLKKTTETEQWITHDNKRPGYNPSNVIYPNLTNAEDTSSTVYADILSNGVKIRGTYNGLNDSGETYVFIAFAEAPLVNSNGVPNNAR